MTRAATLFDSYIVVDWSARSTPATGSDSIWIAVFDRGRGEVGLSNPPTRLAAERLLSTALERRVDRRVIVGIDVGFGYPSGTAAHFGLEGTPWRSMWDQVAASSVDDERNRNNRFEVAAMLNGRGRAGEGPFWGCPVVASGPFLTCGKPPALALREFRLTERHLKAGGRHPKSVWQLLGAGSVGGQTLTAIPILRRLVVATDGRVGVWPFTTGLRMPASDSGTVVLAEVWPSQFDIGEPAGVVKDAAQVRTTARALAAADADGSLARWFAPRLDDASRELVEREEGWVLGPPADRI